MLKKSLIKCLAISLMLYVITAQNFSLPCQVVGSVPMDVILVNTLGSYTQYQVSGNTIIAKISNLTNYTRISTVIESVQNYSLAQAVITFTDPTMPPNAVSLFTPSGANLFAPINSFQYMAAGSSFRSGWNFTFNANNISYCYQNPIYMSISFFRGFFNDLINDTCTQYCYQNFQFASLNGTNIPTQFTCGTYFPCSNYSNPVNISYAATNNNNVYLQTSFNTIVGYWTNPYIGQSMIVSFFGWQPQNGSAIVANLSAYSSASYYTYFTAGVGLGQQNVISTYAGNNTYVFAQKDNSNPNFFIQMTAMNQSSFYFQINLFRQGYNNFVTQQCQTSCSGSIAFANQGNNTTPNQFLCLNYTLNYSTILME